MPSAKPETEPGAADATGDRLPAVQLPDAGRLFLRRAVRLDALAADHPMAEFLHFMAALAMAQRQALEDLPAGSLPDADDLDRARAFDIPPAGAEYWRRDDSWVEALHRICGTMADIDMPEAARAALADLYQAETVALEGLADRFLSGTVRGAERAHTVFVTAALQVYFTRLAGALPEGSVQPMSDPGLCPVCGSWPVAGVVAADGIGRTLHCSLCATAWTTVRMTCAHCGSSRGMGFEELQGHAAGVKAETCPACRCYLKLIYPRQRPQGEPLADDLATLALDHLMAYGGWHRLAPNPFLLTG